ncbi:hypothetical protein BTTAP_70118 [Brochothrix thermosphacta]|nr:hypothetical protein [Brochothrix thermosphacta]SPP30393.1 hypothetical protein BTTAP_70118 [Brochothrix thermosphacta]
MFYCLFSDNPQRKLTFIVNQLLIIINYRDILIVDEGGVIYEKI